MLPGAGGAGGGAMVPGKGGGGGGILGIGFSNALLFAVYCLLFAVPYTVLTAYCAERIVNLIFPHSNLELRAG